MQCHTGECNLGVETGLQATTKPRTFQTRLFHGLNPVVKHNLLAFKQNLRSILVIQSVGACLILKHLLLYIKNIRSVTGLSSREYVFLTKHGESKGQEAQRSDPYIKDFRTMSVAPNLGRKFTSDFLLFALFAKDRKQITV